MGKKREVVTCNVADSFCLAPAGWGVGGTINAAMENTTTRARCVCIDCGEAVCGNCSSIRKSKRGERGRICNDCQTFMDGNDDRVRARLQRIANR